ncbi:MAG: arginine transporter [Pelagimonas sp.]|uniref:arginine transporter n=1 Tax=Pelagimonas sp. TaxID=2073170 RepID=UPI003D6B6015
MRNAALLLVMVGALAACGGGKKERVSRYYGGASSTFATGPVSKACLQANRKAANRRLCGCIQGVANASLSSSDQKMAVSFFKDPHRAQEIRQSDNSRNEAFWKRYKAFLARSEKSCSGY